MNQDELKQLVGTKAVEWIKDGMIVGLGTGSTVKYMVDALGKRVKRKNVSAILDKISFLSHFLNIS